MDYSYFNPPAQQQQQQPHQQQQQQPSSYHHLFGLPPAGTPHPEEFGSVSQPSIEQVAFDYNNYGSFPSSFPGMGVAPPHSPPESFTRNSNKSTDISDELVGVGGRGVTAAQSQAMLDNFDDGLADRKSGRSSSEEKEILTPAQNRRKAQNRAAQRAFRERKERHVRELEQKLNDLEQTSTDLHADNERLKRELARIATENEILRATGSKQNGNNNDNGDSHEINDHHHNRHHSDNHTTTGPLKFSPIDVQKSIADSSKDGNLPHRIVISDKTGERLLNARATWDMIQDHSLFKQGLVDIGDVCNRLKGFEKCDGQGPVFEEGCVRKAIEESVGCGNDELI